MYTVYTVHSIVIAILLMYILDLNKEYQDNSLNCSARLVRMIHTFFSLIVLEIKAHLFS